MGIFSKLLNGDTAGAFDALKDAAQKVAGEAADKLKEAQTAIQNDLANRPAETAPAAAPAQQAAPQAAPRSDGPSGFSWGEDMPDEENQYNFGGSYIQYFEMIFREDFSEYAVTKDVGKNPQSPVYTFTSGGRKALVVELKSEASEAQRVRRAAQAEGVPYVRFYYDHDGWWNTRKYVRARISRALMG